MELKPSLDQYEEHAFLALVEAIWHVDMDERSHDALVTHFNRIVGHPAGSDLLFYSNAEETGSTTSPGSIVQTIKAWHLQNGRTAFKDQASPAPPVRQTLTREQRAAQTSTRNLERVRKWVAEVEVAERQATLSFADLEQQLGLDPVFSDPYQQLAASLATLRSLEKAQHQAMRAMAQLERLQMSLKLAREGAVRDAASPFLDASIQAVVLQEITVGSQRHAAALSTAQARHPDLYARGATLIDSLEARIAQLAEATVSGPGHGPLTLKAAMHSAGLYPALLTAQGLSREVAQQQHHLLKTFRSAIAELEWQVSSRQDEHHGTYADVVEFVLSTPSDDPRFALTLPVAEMLAGASYDWVGLATTRAEVSMPMRMCSMLQGAAGGTSTGVKRFTRYSHVALTSTNGAVPSSVRVRAADWDAERQVLVFTSEGESPVTVQWHSGSASYTPRDASRPSSIGFLRMPSVPLMERFADISQVRFDDYVVVFPADAGIEPVYIMFRDRRER